MLIETFESLGKDVYSIKKKWGYSRNLSSISVSTCSTLILSSPESSFGFRDWGISISDWFEFDAISQNWIRRSIFPWDFSFFLIVNSRFIMRWLCTCKIVLFSLKPLRFCGLMIILIKTFSLFFTLLCSFIIDWIRIRIIHGLEWVLLSFSLHLFVFIRTCEPTT